MIGMTIKALYIRWYEHVAVTAVVDEGPEELTHQDLQYPKEFFGSL
jgi:hypothetical protein